MADQAFTEKTMNTGKTGANTNFEGANRTARSTADQVASAGRDLKDKASDFASSSGEKIREQASDLMEAAKDAGSDAVDRFKEMLDTQKHAGAQYVGGIAEAMRRAARELDNDVPFAGTFLRNAASQVESVSDTVKHGDFNDLLGEAQDFARRQPAAFLGMTVLAGFGIVRLLKSSNQGSYGDEPDLGGTFEPDLGETFESEMGQGVVADVGQPVAPAMSATGGQERPESLGRRPESVAPGLNR
jgi:hypothetical protein